VISDPDVVGLLYLVTIVCFIVALRFLSSPRHARKGNWVGGAGMLVAIATTLLLDGIGNWAYLVIAGVIGTVVGVVGARNVRMTAMPQMVAIFNGVGGGAAALVALAEWHNTVGPVWDETVSIVLSALIGSISFAGSIVAFAKLQELVSGRPIVFPAQNVVNVLVLLVAAGLGTAAVAGVEEQWVLWALIGLALLFGVMFVLPIGGADMPVVISLLNAFTGLAASATGFVLDSTVLIVSGMLVGAAGTLLTLLMAKAMNRSVANVLFGAFGRVQTASGAARADDGRTVRSTTPDDVAVQLAFARKVIVVPGYGMAVAQAQHDVRQLADVLEARGVDVQYAIHPVAGRMPGHMNVLLAEANVPYTQLFEMDQINPEFPQTDVALVIGANDVTNPAARSDPSSPIYGMPILDVDKAASIVVLKRSMRPGFAGIDNELYLDPKTTMLFGDAKESVLKLISAVKSS
jgi:proton-translocating NAD(P)+ transhydrogenase subunit beta